MSGRWVEDLAIQYYFVSQDCVLRSAHAYMLPHARGEGSRQSKSSLNTEHRRGGCACDEPSHAMEVTEVVMHFYMLLALQACCEAEPGQGMPSLPAHA